MMVQTANVLMALRMGGSVRLANDIERVLAQHRVERPKQTVW